MDVGIGQDEIERHRDVFHAELPDQKTIQGKLAAAAEALNVSQAGLEEQRAQLMADPRLNANGVAAFAAEVHGANGAIQAELDQVRELRAEAGALIEVQTLVRHAEVWLRLDPEDQRERVQKVLILARLLQINERDPSDRPVFPLGEATWTPEQIADVEARARAWGHRIGAKYGEPFLLDRPAHAHHPLARLLVKDDDSQK